MSTVAARRRVRRIGFCTATSGYSADERDRRHAIIGRKLPAGYEVELANIPGGPEFLDHPEDFDGAISAAAAFAAGLPADRFEIIISAGALDPGLAALRSLAPVPVVGPGESSLFIGAILGGPLSIVTVDPLAVSKAEPFVDATKVKPPIASIRSIDRPVRSIMQDLDAARAALLSTCRAAVHEDGATTIMLGAMTLGTLGVEDDLRAELGVSVINPIEASMSAAIACLEATATA